MSLGDSATAARQGRAASARRAKAASIGWRSGSSSVALLLLGVWLIASLLFLPSLDQRDGRRVAARAERRGADGAVRRSPPSTTGSTG